MAPGVPDDGLYMTPWEPPAPDGVPVLRATMARQMRLPQEITQTAHVLAMGEGSIVPKARTPLDSARILCEQEFRRLSAAELYFVAADMTELAVTAGESLPDFHLEPEDVPTLTGFVVFAEPIGSYVNTDAEPPDRVPIVAASWGQYDTEFLPRGGLWVTYYSPTDFAATERMAPRLTGRPLRDRERERIRASKGPLTWDNEALLGYGSNLKAGYKPGDSHARANEGGIFAPWVQTLRATWLLMNQGHVVEVEDLQPDRAAARRARRDGLAASPVRLIHLRRATREQGAPADDHRAREYTCRWMVRGHWRQQWYPRRGVHRPVWINPHLKGPEDKPLRTGETVQIWDH